MLINSDNIFTRSLKIGLCYLLVSSTLLLPNTSYAIYHGSRYDNSIDDGNIAQEITVDDRGRCDVGKLVYNPIGSNKDVNWELTNGVCMALLASVGVTLLAAQSASSHLCAQQQVAAENAAQFAAGVMMSPKMIRDRAKEASRCGALTAAGATAQALACCGAMSASILAAAAAFAALAILWDQAGVTFERARICGHDWQKWSLEVEDSSGEEIWVKGDGDYAKCLKNLFIPNDSQSGNNICGTDNSRGVENRSYREWIYGGKEYKDTSEGGCSNPTSWNSERRNKILGYDDDEQRYYMVGAGGAPFMPVIAFYLRLSAVLTILGR